MAESTKDIRIIRNLLIVLSIPVVVVVLKALKAIFIPLILAIFIAFVFAPLTSYLKRKKIPMWLILAITLAIIVIVFWGASLILYAATNSIVTGLPRYEGKFAQLVEQLTAQLSLFAYNLDLANQNFPLVDVSKLFSGSTLSLPKLITSTMSGLMDSMWNIFLILVFLIFILLDAERLGMRLKKVLSSQSKAQTADTINRVEKQIQNYLTVKTIISLATALVGMGLMLLYGVDFVLVCGILLFVLNFIPNIGSIIASAIPMVICMLQGGFDARLLFFSLFIIATQMLFGNILEPRLQGNRLNLTPIMVLISLIFWGWLWGIVGMLICVPLTSAINIIMKQVDPDNLVSAIISSE